MSLSATEVGYVVVVLGAGSYALARTLVLLGGSRQRRLRGVQARARFDAVRTETPLDDPNEVARERGIESIEKHFSVLKRSLVPLIVLLTLLLASPPFLAETSASTASMVGAVVAVVLGFAVRPFLENAVAGLVVSSSRLIRIGDTVRVDDWYGTVEDITATHTAIKVWDWRRYLVPNSRMLQSTFFNYSLFDTFQWAYVEFWVAPDADLDAVREIAIAAPKESKHFHPTEEPRFWLIDIEKDSVCCWVAAWAATPSDAWSLTHDVRTKLLTDLRRAGIPTTLQRMSWTPETPAAPQDFRP